MFIFSYNKNLEQDKNICEHIIKIKIKIMAHETTLERTNTVFKFFTIPKVIHLSLISKLHSNTIDLLHKIQKNFICQGKKAKIKRGTLCNSYEKGNIKNVDLRNKVTSMHYFWVKRRFV